MSFERYISDFGHFESALRDYGMENIQNVLVMNDQDIMRDRITRILEQQNSFSECWPGKNYIKVKYNRNPCKGEEARTRRIIYISGGALGTFDKTVAPDDG